MTHHNGANQELLVSWLRDAHAMEKGLVSTLEKHAKDAKRHPELRSRIEQHVTETRRHAELVEQCLQQLGEKPSNIKNAMAQVMGTFQGLTTGAFKDEEIKNGLSDYAVEHFEIGCYRALVEASRLIGQDDIARVCEQILHEEEDMARFLEQQLPIIVRAVMPDPLPVR